MNGREDKSESKLSTRPRGRINEFLLKYIWLVYSIFFFVEPVMRRSARYWAAFAAVYLVFLALYIGSDFTRGVKQRLIVAALFVLGLCYMPFNQGSSGMVVFAAAVLPFVIRRPAAVYTLLCLGSGVVFAEGMLLHLNTWTWGTGVFFSLVVGFSNSAVAQRHRADSKLRLAHEEIEQLAKLAERERIARDMHDVLGHALSVVVLKSELVGRLIASDPLRATREIADVEHTARTALAEVREAIRGYRSEGLPAELERAQRTLDAAGVTLTCPARPPALAPAEETVVSLIVREAVTNIVRHARASRCEMNFSNADGRLSLVVRDDGRGDIREEGNGLRGMRERVEALGGRFQIDGAGGTRLQIEIPVRS